MSGTGELTQKQPGAESGRRGPDRRASQIQDGARQLADGSGE